MIDDIHGTRTQGNIHPPRIGAHDKLDVSDIPGTSAKPHTWVRERDGREAIDVKKLGVFPYGDTGFMNKSRRVQLNLSPEQTSKLVDSYDPTAPWKLREAEAEARRQELRAKSVGRDWRDANEGELIGSFQRLGKHIGDVHSSMSPRPRFLKEGITGTLTKEYQSAHPGPHLVDKGILGEQPWDPS